MMAPAQLSVEQLRTLARLRAAQLDASITVHQTLRATIVELRRGRRSQLALLEPSGNLLPDKSVRALLAPRRASRVVPASRAH
jgi:hypothetical protein